MDATDRDIILPAMGEYESACRTAGCDGEGVVTTISAPMLDPYVVCGVCGSQTDDLVLVTQTTE